MTKESSLFTEVTVKAGLTIVTHCNLEKRAINTI